MTEQEAQTDWHQDFTGTSVFYFLLKGRKEFVIVEPTQKAQQRFDEWRESEWKRFVKRKTQFLLQFRSIIVIFFLIVNNCDLFPYCQVVIGYVIVVINC